MAKVCSAMDCRVPRWFGAGNLIFISKVQASLLVATDRTGRNFTVGVLDRHTATSGVVEGGPLLV